MSGRGCGVRLMYEASQLSPYLRRLVPQDGIMLNSYQKYLQL